MSLPEASGSPVSVLGGWQGLSEPAPISKPCGGWKKNQAEMHQSVIRCAYTGLMETTTTYTITLSRSVFGDWDSRGCIGNIEECNGFVDVIKDNKQTVTIMIDEEAMRYFLFDLQTQLGIIESNNDGNTGMKRSFNNALAKLQAAQPQQSPKRIAQPKIDEPPMRYNSMACFFRED